jgi:hypothetical protein
MSENESIGRSEIEVVEEFQEAVSQRRTWAPFVANDVDRRVVCTVGSDWVVRHAALEGGRKGADGWCASPVAVEFDRLEVGGELGKARWVGVSPFVDRLVRVAYDDDGQASSFEVAEEIEFGSAAVLSFIDDDLGESRLQQRGDPWVILE